MTSTSASINASDELESLPIGSYFVDARGTRYVITERDERGNVYCMPGFGDQLRHYDIALPVETLHRPDEG